MPTYVFFALGAAIAMAINLLLIKYILKRTVQNLAAYLFYFQALHILFAPFAFLLAPQTSFNGGLPYLVLAGIAWMIATGTIMFALSRIDASITGSLFPLKLIFVPFVAYFLLNEVFTGSIYVWFVPLVLGGFLVTMDERLKPSSFFQKHVGIVIVSLCFYAFYDAFGKLAIERMGMFTEMGWFLVFGSIGSVVYIPFARDSLKISRKALLSMLTIVGFDSLVIFFFVAAFRDNVTLTNAVAMLNAPFLLMFAFILSRIKPGLVEKHKPKVYAIRFLGAAIMYFAALQIVLQ